MPKDAETYKAHVDILETGLSSYAKRSFESFSQHFVDGGNIYEYYEKQWRGAQSGKLKFLNRTPLQLERDRILYSGPIRKQTEKYHVLYNGQRRIVRNYTTHTMRMAQVTRSICRGLGLNPDFAEAIAIGSKVGALPFIHATKGPVAEWIKAKVFELDKTYAQNEPLARSTKSQLSLEFGDAAVPSWIGMLQSSNIFEKVQKYIPWAAGKDVDDAYSSGQQSYWMLCTNPFTMETRSSEFSPETMVGIWRHTRGRKPEKNSFHHRFRIDGAPGGCHELKWNQFTYEAAVVQYADDITWVIENLNDANSAALLNRRPRSMYDELLATLGDPPDTLLRPLTRNDSGGIYTYFITDFVRHSQGVLDGLKDGANARVALREGSPGSVISLSPEAEDQLDKCTEFLHNVVFEEPRVRNRAQMLKTVSLASIDLLYQGWEETLPAMIKEKATLERWKNEQIEKAIHMVTDPIHRIQVVVDILADMGDQEIYDFVGIQSL